MREATVVFTEEAPFCRVSDRDFREMRKELRRIAKLKKVGLDEKILEFLDKRKELDEEGVITLFSMLCRYFFKNKIDWELHMRFDVVWALWLVIERSLSLVCNEDDFEQLRADLIDPNVDEAEKIRIYKELLNRS